MFVHLHNHMEGSFSDSSLRSRSALSRAAEIGMPALAITDHGDLSHLMRFTREAIEAGVKPIIGVEAYFVDDASHNIAARINDRFHLVLLARNITGFRNLLALVSDSWAENCLMQKLGLVDWRLLERYGEGLICLTACLQGPVALSYGMDKPGEAERYYRRLRDIFGEDLFLEVFAHGLEREEKAVAGISELARREGMTPVLTNDCHYLDREDWILHDILIKTRFGRPSDFALDAHEYHFKNEDEMLALGLPPEWLYASIDVASRITLDPDEILNPSDEPGRNSGGTTANLSLALLGIRSPMGPKAAFLDSAGVLGVPRKEMEGILDMIPDSGGIDDVAPDLEPFFNRYPEVLEATRLIEDIPRRPDFDHSRVVRFERGSLSRVAPLRRCEGILFTSWNEDEVISAGAAVLPAAGTELDAPAAAVHLYHEGMAHFRERDRKKAIALFEKALELDPSFENALYQMGLAYYYSKDPAAARSIFDELLAQAPDFERLPFLESYLGWANFHLGDFNEALLHFERSVEEREIAGSLFGLAFSLEKTGRDDEAAMAFEKFLERYPDHQRASQARKCIEKISERAGAL